MKFNEFVIYLVENEVTPQITEPIPNPNPNPIKPEYVIIQDSRRWDEWLPGAKIELAAKIQFSLK